MLTVPKRLIVSTHDVNNQYLGLACLQTDDGIFFLNYRIQPIRDSERLAIKIVLDK